MMSATVEAKKTAPVVADVDVLVVGGGIGGPPAAIAAARNGAKAMVVERFGCLGGNMGPGMFSGGVLHLALRLPFAPLDRVKGIPGEFINRCEGYCDGQLGNDYFRDSQVVSYVWLTMMEENNVGLMLNTVATDPIMEGNRVAGLLVETKSGTQAIRAKAVIDATGDADVAFRAGAPADPDDTYMHPGMYFAVAGVDEERYLTFKSSQEEPSDADLAWQEQRMKQCRGMSKASGFLQPKALDFLRPLYRQAWEDGEYRITQCIGDLAMVTADHGLYAPRNGIVGAQVGLHPLDGGKKLHSGDAAMVNELEIGARKYIFETAQFLRRHVPGFENAHLHMISPYFHFRGGRSAVTEHVITLEDVKAGRRFDDVVFVSYGHPTEERTGNGYDYPYRQLLPKEVEGLLMAGRSGMIQPPSNRNRWKVLLCGQAAGLAATLAARDGVTPREIDVKELQRILYHKYHTALGDEARLRELGVIT